MLQPAVLNHDEACWLVEIAIRARITSTSTPAAAARIWKTRSPSGRRWASGWADPAGAAGSACTAALMTANPSEPLASRIHTLRSDLAELRHGLLVEAAGQRRQADLGEQLLAVAEQVAEVGLEHGRVVGVRLLGVDQVPGLVGDRVGVGAA